MAYDGIMLSRVVEQLQNQITRGRINKIYQISQYELLFHIRAQRRELQITHFNTSCLCENAIDTVKLSNSCHLLML